MPTKSTREYYRELSAFCKKCRVLIKKGGVYLVILANHELFRFMYPYEPYVNFYNSSPVTFLTRKIKELNLFLDTAAKMIGFYKFDFSGYTPAFEAKKGIESKTARLYSNLWEGLGADTMLCESGYLIKKRIPKGIIEENIKDKTVLDAGCGSGRYSLALSLLGAKKVYAVDLSKESYRLAESISKKRNLKIKFLEANFQHLPFRDNYFDFIFCNGALHHSTSISKGLKELRRVMKINARGFIYLYARGGIFWDTRRRMRQIFKGIPFQYTLAVLKVMGAPDNRFIFSDVWHVPIETHTSRKDLEDTFKRMDFNFQKVISRNGYDLDRAVSRIVDGKAAWGDGEHRYIIEKQS